MSNPAISEFGASFRGTLVTPSSESYDAERKVFNAMIDKKPQVIAKCSTAQDIVDALQFGQREGLEISVRAGGHSVAGLSLNDGGIVIDLRQMNQTEVDPAAKTIKVGGGTVWGEFDAACKPHGLATTGGRVTTTGVAGLTLGGGSGWMERRWGLAADNLISVELVTVDGRIINASEDENPELFWGLHGAGANFGIAASLTFKLYPISEFTGGLIFWQRDRGKEVGHAYRDLIADAPDGFGGGFGFLTAPPEEFVPTQIQGKVVCAAVLAFEGSEEELRDLVKPLYDSTPMEGDLIVSVPYHDFNGMLDDPPGHQNWWTAEYHDEAPDQMIDEFTDYCQTMTPSGSQMVLIPWGGAVAARQDFPMANRHSKWVSHPFGVWEDASENEERIAWTRGLAEVFRRYSNGGTYLNFTASQGQERVIAAYGPDNHKRLAALKSEYDPQNVLHGNNNILPLQ